MAFNFLGQIPSQDKFDEFVEFVTKESKILEFKIAHLNSEIKRCGLLLTTLKRADALLRSGSNKSLPSDSYWMSDFPPPDPYNVKLAVNDSLNAIDVDALKRFVLDSIKSKRESHEFRIRKTLDLIEQHENEITNIQERLKDFEDIITKIKTRFNSTDYPEITDIEKDITQGKDIYSKDANYGVITDGSTLKYELNKISGSSLIFKGYQPGLKEGQKIQIVDSSKNSGIFTVRTITNDKIITVEETLSLEKVSKAKVLIPG